MKRLEPLRIAAFLAVVLLAATAHAARESGPPGGAYAFQRELQFVRTEPIETGAPENAHPVTIPAEALKRSLATLQATGSVSPTPVPVFTDEELDLLAPHLAAALAGAAPREDVTFAVVGKHGVFGNRSPSSATTGRVFVQAGKLQCVFGLVHQ